MATQMLDMGDARCANGSANVTDMVEAEEQRLEDLKKHDKRKAHRSNDRP